MTMMEQPIWAEEIEITGAYLDEAPLPGAPGTIAIRWRSADGYHELLISGNDADDLIERYRASPDSEHKDLVLRQAIWAGVQP